MTPSKMEGKRLSPICLRFLGSESDCSDGFNHILQMFEGKREKLVKRRRDGNFSKRYCRRIVVRFSFSFQMIMIMNMYNFCAP